MFKSTGYAALLAGIIGVGLSLPAHAEVVYDLTFYVGTIEEGTGTLILPDIDSLSAVKNLDESLTALDTDWKLTTSTIDGANENGGTGFTISSSNVNTSDDLIKTLADGDIDTLKVFQTEPTTDGTPTPSASRTNYPYLEENGGNFQVHGKNDSASGWPTGTVDISGPILEGAALTPTPLPSTLPLFAGGLALVGLLAWRRRRSAPRRLFAGT